MKTGGKRNSDTGTEPIDTGTTVTWNTETGTPTQFPSKGTANVKKGARTPTELKAEIIDALITRNAGESLMTPTWLGRIRMQTTRRNP